MAGIAQLAKQLAFEVQGSDKAFNPPMSTQLEALDILLHEGLKPAEHLSSWPDLVIVGNALSRGNETVEMILNQKIPYISGPQWLYENVLKDRHVIAVAGTHGKTTTTAMLVHILQQTGLNPGYLIGGCSPQLSHSAQLGEGDYFVIEADEYDTAFFDKRPKFLHYHPNTLVINNIEFDHGDIYHNLEEIKRQFHYLVRTVPASGTIVAPAQDQTIQAVLDQGCWSHIQDLNQDWQVNLVDSAGQKLAFFHGDKAVGQLSWALWGQHNAQNALAALVAANDIGINPEQSIKALSSFQAPYKRMQYLGNAKGFELYEDFAHHPTAIETSISGLKARMIKGKLFAIVDFGTNTMKSGVHDDVIPNAMRLADHALILSAHELFNHDHVLIFKHAEGLVEALQDKVQSGDTVLIMSNDSGQQLTELISA